MHAAFCPRRCAKAQSPGVFPQRPYGSCRTAAAAGEVDRRGEAIAALESETTPWPRSGETIRLMKSAIQKAKLGRDEELQELKRLDHQARLLERTAKGPRSMHSLLMSAAHRPVSVAAQSLGMRKGPLIRKPVEARFYAMWRSQKCLVSTDPWKK